MVLEQLMEVFKSQDFDANKSQSILDALEVKDNKIRTEFVLNGVHYQIDKKLGLPRLLTAASRIISLLTEDEIGFDMGDYDAHVERFMKNVSYDNGTVLIDLTKDEYNRHLESFDFKDMILMSKLLPMMSAFALLGKSITEIQSETSTESSVSQSTTDKTQESEKQSNKNARSSIKRAS